uniref:Uncharacterized protein n=1 Tax=Meloidogyne enterolobii TaxID=390850 RepID=A0A6V7WNU5_MELEN|nr:unnamed protein product [Meloidogyne enterolobii]
MPLSWRYRKIKLNIETFRDYAATNQSVSTLSPLASFVPTVEGTGKSCKYSTSAIKINS